MATSKEFQEKFKSGNVLEAFKLALSEVVHLNITTTVVTAESPTASESEGRHRMRTLINLIDGDIETEINSRFLNDSLYTDLRQFHMNQVREGRQIIRDNVASLQALLQACVQMTGHPDSATNTAATAPNADLWSSPIAEPEATPPPPPPGPPSTTTGSSRPEQPLTPFSADSDYNEGSLGQTDLTDSGFVEASFGAASFEEAGLDDLADETDYSDADFTAEVSLEDGDQGLGSFEDVGLEDALDLDVMSLDPSDLPPDVDPLGDLDLSDALGDQDFPAELADTLTDTLAVDQEAVGLLDDAVAAGAEAVGTAAARLENPFPDDDPISELIKAAQEAVPTGQIPDVAERFKLETVEFDTELQELIVNPVKKVVADFQDQEAETVPDVGNPLAYIQAQLVKRAEAIAAANPINPQQLEESLNWVSQAFDQEADLKTVQKSVTEAVTSDSFFDQAEPLQIVERALDPAFLGVAASFNLDSSDTDSSEDDDLLDFADTDFGDTDADEEGSYGLDLDQDLSLEADMSAAAQGAVAASAVAGLDDNPLGEFEIPDDLDPLADLELPGLEMPSLDSASPEADLEELLPPPPPPSGFVRSPIDSLPKTEPSDAGLDLGADLDEDLGEDLDLLGDALMDLGDDLEEEFEEAGEDDLGSIEEAMDSLGSDLPEGSIAGTTEPIVPPLEAMDQDTDALDDFDLNPPVSTDTTIDLQSTAVSTVEDSDDFDDLGLGVDDLEEDLDLEELDLSDRLVVDDLDDSFEDDSLGDSLLDDDLLMDEAEDEASPPVPPPGSPVAATPAPTPPASTASVDDLGLESVDDFDMGPWDEAPAGTPLEEESLEASLDFSSPEPESDLNLAVIDDLDDLDDLSDLEDLDLDDLEEEVVEDAPGLGPDTTDPLANLFGNTAPEDFGELDAMASEKDLLLAELGSSPPENHPPVDLDDLALLDDDDPFASLELDEEDNTPPPPPPRPHP
ncbi:MAG: hypothetical protein ACO34J_09180 [Prochlorothrix sp.]